MKAKYFLHFLVGVSSTILLSAHPALAQSTEEINSILKTTNSILLVIAGILAAISSFNSSLIGVKLVARGSPVFPSLLAPISTSFLAIIVILTGGLILKQWNFAFTCVVAANGGIFLIDLFIAAHHF